MLKFTLKRLASLVVVLIGVSFLVFMLLSLTPGDPVRMMLGESATPEAQEALREEMGLNDPLLVQYGRYMKNIIVHQDLGTSYTTQRPIKTRGSMLLKLLAFRICDSKISGNIVSQVVEDIFFLEAGGNRLCQVILYIEIIAVFYLHNK